MALPVGLRPSLAECQHMQALPPARTAATSTSAVSSLGPASMFHRLGRKPWFSSATAMPSPGSPRSTVSPGSEASVWSTLPSRPAPPPTRRSAPPFKRPYGECAEWRDNAMRRIAAEDPALVLLTSSDGFIAVGNNGQPLVDGPGRALKWRAGMSRTIAALQAVADQVTVALSVNLG